MDAGIGTWPEPALTRRFFLLLWQRGWCGGMWMGQCWRSEAQWAEELATLSLERCRK